MTPCYTCTTAHAQAFHCRDYPLSDGCPFAARWLRMKLQFEATTRISEQKLRTLPVGSVKSNSQILSRTFSQLLSEDFCDPPTRGCSAVECRKCPGRRTGERCFRGHMKLGRLREGDRTRQRLPGRHGWPASSAPAVEPWQSLGKALAVVTVVVQIGGVCIRTVWRSLQAKLHKKTAAPCSSRAILNPFLFVTQMRSDQRCVPEVPGLRQLLCSQMQHRFMMFM